MERDQENKETEKNYKTTKKTNGNKHVPINNYFKCKESTCSNQRHRVAKWVKKQDPFIYCLQETHFR